MNIESIDGGSKLIQKKLHQLMTTKYKYLFRKDKLYVLLPCGQDECLEVHRAKIHLTKHDNKPIDLSEYDANIVNKFVWLLRVLKDKPIPTSFDNPFNPRIINNVTVDID